jgi:hypothetical protein
MKRSMKSIWLGVPFISFCVVLLAGCHSLQDTQFAPLEARLELGHSGGAQYLVVINSSGQELHNVHFRGYMWGDSPMTYTGDPNTSLPQRVPQETYTFIGSSSRWSPGAVVHFKDRDMDRPGIILRPVTSVKIVGTCDEGPFREEWLITSSGQLQLVEPRP